MYQETSKQDHLWRLSCGDNSLLQGAILSYCKFIMHILNRAVSELLYCMVMVKDQTSSGAASYETKD